MTGLVSECDEVDLALQVTLDGLKDFQRATVMRIAALFSDPQHKGRVLVADEVGLGKTVVARGLIATMLLGWKRDRPLRVIYICSNLALAEENRAKLAVFAQARQRAWVREPSFSRLAEVAVQTDQQNHQGALLEVCTLTPATSFTLTRGAGNRRERSIIFSALLKHPQMAPLRRRLSDLFRNQVQDVDGWKGDLEALAEQVLNPDIVAAFHQRLLEAAVKGGPSWLDQLQAVAALPKPQRADAGYPLLCRLRLLFVKACAGHLEADLFILDEFQRFDSLLDPNEDNEHALISQQVFGTERERKILLLSATPFKAMSTVDEDENDEGHLLKLQQILGFLNQSPLDAYEPARKALQAELLRLRQAQVKVADLDEGPRLAVEQVLRPLIARTERSQIAAEVDSLINAEPLKQGPQVRPDDIRAFVELDQLARELEAGSRLRLSSQMLEFFKSAAWPLSFSTGYQMQEVLKRQYQAQDDIRRQADRGKHLWLPREQIRRYRLNIGQDAPNPQVRWLAAHLFAEREGHGPEMLLWVPPSRPHYPLSGCFAGHEGFSKTLLFSAWAMVPRMISGLVSYEAERRVLQHGNSKAEYFSGPRDGQSSHHDERRAVIKLANGDLANWSLLYPCKALIDIPLERGAGSLQQQLRSVTSKIRSQAKALRQQFGKRPGGRNQHHWYLLAPMLLDGPEWAGRWLSDLRSLTGLSSGMHKRIEEIARRFERIDELGSPPDDLEQHLAWLALGSPAVCAYRALRQNPEGELRTGHASRVALGFVSLFNGVAGSAIVRRLGDPAPWRSIVKYCAQGGIQAMLEEYGYLLAGAKGVAQVVDTLDNVLRTAPSNVKAWRAGDHKDDTHLRCHYAVQLGAQQTTNDDGQKRVVSIRESFNSPFRPFVLASTSIGQEGLDFHWYCSEVVHWNLPRNPIDLEQREGRVNRFQSLVIRRRVAQASAAQEAPQLTWAELFQAEAARPWPTHLVPYWHYPHGDARIRRLVPTLAMSHEALRYPHMQKILSLYRLAFGQPGQSELLEHLRSLELEDEELAVLKDKLMVRLAPVLQNGRVRTPGARGR